MPSHNQRRNKICLICLKKTKDMRIFGHFNYLNGILPFFDHNNELFPTTMCKTCFNAFNHVVNTNALESKVKALKVRVADEQYKDFNAIQDYIIQEGFDCNCFYCQRVQQRFFKPYPVSKPLPPIDQTNDISDSVFDSQVQHSQSHNDSETQDMSFDSQKSEPSTKPSCSTSKDRDTFKTICTECLTIKYHRHVCNKPTLIKNVMEIIEANQLDTAILQKLLVKKKKNFKKNVPVTVSVNHETKEYTVAQNSKHDPKAGLKLALKLRKYSVPSKTKQKLAMRDIRAAYGRKVFSANVVQEIEDMEKEMEEFFMKRSMIFLTYDKNAKKWINKSETIVFCVNVAGFISYVEKKLGLTNSFIKVSLDGGKGSFKISFSISDESNQKHWNSVKHVFILALAPNVSEHYNNILQLWTLLKLNDLERDYIIIGDLKVVNILLGLMSYSARYPCSWCIARKIGNVFETEAELRTFEDIASWYEKSKHDKNGTYSVKRMPIVWPERFLSRPILCFIVPPSLHLLLGGTNRLFKYLLSINKDLALRYARLCGLKKKANKGQDFAGNGCRKILKRTLLLRILLDKTEVNDEERNKCLDTILALEAFNAVVQKCFGNSLSPDYAEAITELREKLTNLPDLDEIPKFHVLLTHVVQFLGHQEYGLGKFSEHAFESLHSEFHKVFVNYAVNTDNPEYGDRLVRALICFNYLNTV